MSEDKRARARTCSEAPPFDIEALAAEVRKTWEGIVDLPPSPVERLAEMREATVIARSRDVGKAWEDLARARGDILIAYRTGRQPSGKALDEALRATRILQENGIFCP